MIFLSAFIVIKFYVFLMIIEFITCGKSDETRRDMRLVPILSSLCIFAFQNAFSRRLQESVTFYLYKFFLSR